MQRRGDAAGRFPVWSLKALSDSNTWYARLLGKAGRCKQAAVVLRRCEEMPGRLAPLRRKPKECKRVSAVNYLGYVYGTLAALKRILQRDRGLIALDFHLF